MKELRVDGKETRIYGVVAMYEAADGTRYRIEDNKPHAWTFSVLMRKPRTLKYQIMVTVETLEAAKKVLSCLPC